MRRKIVFHFLTKAKLTSGNSRCVSNGTFFWKVFAKHVKSMPFFVCFDKNGHEGICKKRARPNAILQWCNFFHLVSKPSVLKISEIFFKSWIIFLTFRKVCIRPDFVSRKHLACQEYFDEMWTMYSKKNTVMYLLKLRIFQCKINIWNFALKIFLDPMFALTKTKCNGQQSVTTVLIRYISAIQRENKVISQRFSTFFLSS